ncbi:hypothetical protein KFL_002070060 [Klebsormidium nitens]|uniref:TRP C-terminal domain-containing protein n=1 Tax=Klebsormidium nitens TaxID=105231 RepID=A0A1Y1I1M1_KLENI|nr:hypothetical protein KFL_002070060 [Klebsormidium nitens]|eukprot:GAQ84810.1 hypothetical protein KFL_002070060 [Klebsormidium nitens]
MVRTVQQMMTSLPRTLDTTPAYTIAAPADLGTMVLNPPIGEFINTNQWRLAFQLTGGSAAACVNTPCVSTCQLDDNAPVPCGAGEGQLQLEGLSVGGHRLTIQTTDGFGSLVASRSVLFTVDPVPPVVVVALEVGTTRISQQTLNGVSTTFLVWDVPEPCPGYLVISEPCPQLESSAFQLSGGSLQNLRFDQQLTTQARRRLLQTWGTITGDGPTGYRFQVVPEGTGPSLMTVAAKPGGFRDRAGNPVNLTADSSFTAYYDSGRPTPKITRADSGRPGLSTDVNVTLLVDFGQPVTGFGPSGADVRNGTLIGFTKDDSYTNGQLYLLDCAIVPSQTLIVQIPENVSADYAGHPNLPSNEFQVLNYEVDPAVTRTVQVTAATALVVSGVAATFAGPFAFGGAFSNMAAWAASENLATPLPPVYVDATQAVSFSLFHWTCPFSAIDFTDSGETPDSPFLANQTNGTPAGPSGGVTSAELFQGSINTKGRRLMGADSLAARALCGKGFGESVKRLERVRSYQARGELSAGESAPHRRALLQGGWNLAGDDAPQFAARTVPARLPTNESTSVTVVASNVGGNATSTELMESLYQTLLTDGKAVSNFLQGNLPDTANEGLQTFLCALFWIAALLLVMLFIRVLTGPLMRKFKNVPDILVFPALEFILVNAAVIGLVTASIGVIMGGTRLGKVLGGVVLALVVFYIIWAILYVYYHVVSNKTVAFVVKEMDDGMGGQVRAQNTSTRGLRAVAKWCDRALSGHAQGEWEPVHTQRHRFFTARYGVFFDDLIGTPMERIGDATLSRHPSYVPSMRRSVTADVGGARSTLSRRASDGGALLTAAGPGDVSAGAGDVSGAGRRASVDAGELARAAAAAAPPADVDVGSDGDVSPHVAAGGADEQGGGGGGPVLTKSRSRRRSSVYRKQQASLAAQTQLPSHVAPTWEALNSPGGSPRALPGPSKPPLARSVSISPDSSAALERPRLERPVDFLTGDRYSPGRGSPLRPPIHSALKRATSMPSEKRHPGSASPGRRYEGTSPIHEIEPADTPAQGLTNPETEPVAHSTANPRSNPAANPAPGAVQTAAPAEPNPFSNLLWGSPNPSPRLVANPKRPGVAHAVSRNLSRGSAKVQEFKQEYGGFLRPYYFTLQLFFYGVEGVVLASFPNDEGSWTQLSIIFILKALLAVFILFFMPFQEAGPQLCELINAVSDVASASIAIALLAMAASGVRGPNRALGIVMIALQALPIFAIIFLSSVDVFVFLKVEGWPMAKRMPNEPTSGADVSISRGKERQRPSRLRLWDPVEHAGLMNPDECRSTYKHTPDATAETLTCGTH